jgi:hypothetical protein
MTSSVSSIPIIIPNVFALKSSGGKLSYPVQPNQTMAAQFRHIVTYPSDDGADSASVFKLRILDNLIEQLAGEAGKGEDFLRISGNNVDSLIAKLKTEASIQRASEKTSYGNLKPGLGIILDTFA